jgi:transcriptional regulator with XRE-family HTH domain
MSDNVLGERLRQLRIEHKYSQKDVAELTGVTRSTYAGYENNNAPPDVFIIIKLAKLYKTSTDFILFGVTENFILPLEFKEVLNDLPHERINNFWEHLIEFARYLSKR